MPPAKSPASQSEAAAVAVPGAEAPSRRMTLRDVARALGVSVATVSNAYNRPDQLSPELRERVLAQAAVLGYTGPDPLARSLRRGRTGVIGVLYDAPLAYAFADPAASLFLGGVAGALHQAGLNLLLLSGIPEAGSSHALHRATVEASVDGFISYATAQDSPLLAAALARHLPTVLVDQVGGSFGARPVIGIEDEHGAAQAARHLRDLGYRQIGVLGLALRPDGYSGPVSVSRLEGTASSHMLARLRGYRSALEGWPGDLHVYEVADNTPAAGEVVARRLLDDHPQITALLCMSDVLAQGALAAAQGLGRSVPGDLGLVGYDDIPSSAALNLTTVAQPTSRKGEEAGRAMLALLRGETPPGLTLPTELVVRGSTAPAPVSV